MPAVHRGRLAVVRATALRPRRPDDEPQDQPQQPDAHQNVADGLQVQAMCHGDRDGESEYRAHRDQCKATPAAALAGAAPRIEHGSVLPADLVSRIADLGVTVCLQPSFAVTDAAQVPVALGADRAATAYPWACLAASRAKIGRASCRERV